MLLLGAWRRHYSVPRNKGRTVRARARVCTCRRLVRALRFGKSCKPSLGASLLTWTCRLAGSRTSHFAGLERATVAWLLSAGPASPTQLRQKRALQVCHNQRSCTKAEGSAGELTLGLPSGVAGKDTPGASPDSAAGSLSSCYGDLLDRCVSLFCQLFEIRSAGMPQQCMQLTSRRT